MTTPNERKIRAGYDLFLAADPNEPRDWTSDAPVAALMAEKIRWYDDEGSPRGLREEEPSFSGKGNGENVENLRNPDSVLGRLRQLRSQMPCCQILSCFEDEGKVVHTVDHALKSDPDSYRGTRPHLCASSFEFDEVGKVKTVRYCSSGLPLNLPRVPGS
jgi:hypothetical protein